MGNKRVQKRKVSSFIPYRKNGEEILVYLQKKSEKAERHAGYFVPFGGGSEGSESPEETLIREMEEELNYRPKNYEFLGVYDFNWGIASVFVEEVKEDFENKIKVGEGDYGIFMNKSEVLKEPKLSDDDKVVLNVLFEKLRTNRQKDRVRNDKSNE